MKKVLEQYRRSNITNEELITKLMDALIEERKERIKQLNNYDLKLRAERLVCQEVIPKSNNPHLG